MLAINMKGTYLFFKMFWFVLAYALASGSFPVTRSEVNMQASRDRQAVARG